METITDIPFSLDDASLMAQAHLEPGSEDAADMRSLIALARRVGRPKAAYAASFIEARDGDTLRIGSVTFTSRALCHRLQSVQRVFPMVTTCGQEMDAAFPAKGDMLKEYWWELIKSCLLAAAETHLRDHLRSNFRVENTAIMRPGAGDPGVWPIEQQRELFALLGGVEGRIGVRLTESFLMSPNKSASGLLFPTEKDFRECELCHRADCASRSAPFDKELWDAIQGDAGTPPAAAR